ncbi:MAG: 16S rRNA (uracil(1498)-N(3))-methyltransferase [Planctomycetes bacterium]|nr:16S rRNA (uracil(1498)-N(3))-methyltransferase [Planctomycetota bacterium]
MARMRTLLAPPLEGPDEVILSPEQSHHALRVLRLPEGSRATLLDPSGIRAEAVLTGTQEGLARFRIERRLPPPAPEGREVHLACALPKSRGARWLVQKGTELGVAVLSFVRTERGTVRPRPDAIDAWERIAREACKQSGRHEPPVLAWTETLGDLPQGAPLWFADPAPDAPPLAVRLHAIGPEAQVRIAIGPEGGWTDGERQVLRDLGGTPFSLGPTILRVETAAIASAAVARFG